MLQELFAEFNRLEDVKIMLKALEFARIFHFFELRGLLSTLETLLKEHKQQDLQYLQEQSLQLLRELLTQYC